MNPGGEAGERLVITNRGFAPVELTIRKVSGPEWVRLRSSEDLGFIEPGQSRDVLFALNPPAATPTGQYDTRFEVRGGGLAAQYQVFVTLSASGRGDASFKIIDVLINLLIGKSTIYHYLCPAHQKTNIQTFNIITFLKRLFNLHQGEEKKEKVIENMPRRPG